MAAQAAGPVESSWYKVSLHVEAAYLQTTEGDLCGRTLWDFCAGQAVSDWDCSRAFLRCGVSQSNGLLTDRLCDHLGLYVFSSRLLTALEAYGCNHNDFQLLPITVYNFHGGRIEGYSVINALTLTAALDRERSFLLDTSDTEIDPATGKAEVLSVGRPAVYGDTLAGHDLVCLQELRLIHLVSRRFKDAFQSIQGTGMSFNPIMVDGCYA